ncbi:MAG: hypothetical protein ACFCUI_08295 [Bernardetiaceae bacterium]
MSIWASGESIARSFALPKFVCYVFAFVMVAGAAFGLTLIKRGLGRGDDGYVFKIIFGLGAFLFLWMTSLLSNTHNFYYVGAVDNIRNNELRGIKNRLELIDSKGINAFERAREEFRSQVEAEIENFKNQITNLGDPGRGPKAEKIIIRIERLLETELTELNPPGSGLPALRKYADQYADLIRGILNAKLENIDKNIKALKENINTPEYQRNLESIQMMIDAEPRPEPALKKVLRDGYALFNKLFEYIEDIFRSPFLKERTNAELTLEPLPSTPESIDLEHIANSWSRILSGQYDQSRFWIALIFALVIDIASFVIWYYGVLTKEPRY